MAADPVYTTTPNIGGGTTPATADTSTTTPTNTTTVFTAGASGSKVELIRVTQILTTASAGILNIFLHDGSNYYLFDWINYGIQTVSTTANAGPMDLYPSFLPLPTGWTIRVTNTVASGTGATGATHKVVVTGANL